MIASMAHIDHTRLSPWTLPNLLTLGRLAAVPALFACAFWDGPQIAWLAFAIFVAASITDYADGYLARLRNEQSALGQILDPIADKLLVAAALVLLVARDTIFGIHLWAVVAILSRELLVSGLREYLAGIGATLAVSSVAKIKTAAQMVALAALLIVPAITPFWPHAHALGLAALWVAALLTLYTGFDYCRGALHHISRNG